MNITLNLDLRQIRKPGTYVLQAEDKETLAVYTLTLNFTTAPRITKNETREERERRIESQRLRSKEKKHDTLVRTFEGTATSGKAWLYEMARVANVSARTIRRYIHEFSDEFRVKKDCVTRLNGEANNDGTL